VCSGAISSVLWQKLTFQSSTSTVRTT
jgi:hypothetical protein